MTLAAVTVLISVNVLITHYSPRIKAPPSWMSNLATAFRIRQPQTTSRLYGDLNNKNPPPADPDSGANDKAERRRKNLPDPENGHRGEKADLSGLVSILSDILAEIRAEKEIQKVIAERRELLSEWRRVARAVDMISFSVCLVLFVFHSIYTLFLYPQVIG